MGEHTVNTSENIEARNQFIRELLNDVEALEYLLVNNLLENDKIRIGAEQEFFLINDDWRPAVDSDMILLALNDYHYTTEMSRYTLEINIDPLKLQTNCFHLMERQLNSLLNKAKNVASQYHSKVLLTGILPTVTKNELSLKYMTPLSRYHALNTKTKKMRGTDFSFHIEGVDEISVLHDSILFEGCNASFQMHLQVSPQDFVASYNWAQAIAGPVLAISSNSPILMGRELWSETRIALFQQSVDTRASSYTLKEKDPRVSFGQEWAAGTVVDLFKRDIARHEILLTKDIPTNSHEDIKNGKTPKLQALKIFNSTMYHWNRACYGISKGKPHLRIENRYLPAGPTTTDEIANFAFWAGLMVGRPKEFDDMPAVMNFKDAKANFLKAARTGKESVMQWQEELVPVNDLIIKKLIPMARKGLEKLKINSDDITKYLGIIEQRTIGQSGAQWQISSYHQLLKNYKKDTAILCLTKAIYDNQQGDLAVHTWPAIKSEANADASATMVGQIMSTQLFVIHEQDLADLATSIMLWNDIHHLLVENDQSELAGLLTWTHIQKNHKKYKSENYTISEIMIAEPLTIRPETSIREAIELMKANEYGCLPVVSKNELLGIITINDVLAFDHGKSKQQGIK
jgi:CBS domain-containing protein